MFENMTKLSKQVTQISCQRVVYTVEQPVATIIEKMDKAVNGHVGSLLTLWSKFTKIWIDPRHSTGHTRKANVQSGSDGIHL